MTTARVLLVGHQGGTHIAASLMRACQTLGMECVLVQENLAYQGYRLWRAFNWRLRGRHGSSVAKLSEAFQVALQQFKPTHVIVTGISQLRAADIQYANALGVKTINFLTDDPWNPANASARCLRAISEYQFCLTPRRANLAQLKAINANHVSYLPFGFDADLLGDSKLEEPSQAASNASKSADVMFVGGGDPDRFAMLTPLHNSGLRVAIYGGYWRKSKFPQFDLRGIQSPAEIASATQEAKLSLILVRRANRDEHTMRSFEAAAAGGALLVEDTRDHRELFGESVAYFSDAQTLVSAARAVLDDEARLAQMRISVRRRMLDGAHTYLDRLQQMLKL